jgi:hypothetical protein
VETWTIVGGIALAAFIVMASYWLVDLVMQVWNVNNDDWDV